MCHTQSWGEEPVQISASSEGNTQTARLTKSAWRLHFEQRGGLHLTVRVRCGVLPLLSVKHNRIHGRLNIDLLQKSFFSRPQS